MNFIETKLQNTFVYLYSKGKTKNKLILKQHLLAYCTHQQII